MGVGVKRQGTTGAAILTVESRLGESVVVSVQDLLEGGDGVLQRDETTLDTGKDLGDGEGLRHEPTRARETTTTGSAL